MSAKSLNKETYFVSEVENHLHMSRKFITSKKIFSIIMSEWIVNYNSLNSANFYINFYTLSVSFFKDAYCEEAQIKEWDVHLSKINYPEILLIKKIRICATSSICILGLYLIWTERHFLFWCLTMYGENKLRPLF